MPNKTKTHRILRLILFLSNSYPKTKDECNSFLEIKDSAFYNYRNILLDTGFDIRQKDGKYWIAYPDHDHQVLRNVLHFSEEESYLLSRSIDLLEEKPTSAARLKEKLVAFLNQDKAIDAYINKEKSAIVHSLRKAQQERKQVLLVNYASGNSQTIRSRLVEPFEFKDDFNLVWAFDVELNKNRQFKICRIEDICEMPFDWENRRLHRSLPVDIFRNTGKLNKQVEFCLNLRAKNLLVEEYPLSEKYLTATKKNHFVFRAPVAKYEGPGRFAMGIAEDVRLVGDDGFLEFMKIKINKCQHFLSDFTNSGVD